MNKIIFLLGLFFVLAFTGQSNAQKGYEITLKIKNLPNKDIILGHYFASNKNTLVDDTIQLNTNGIGVIKGNKPLPEGMYFLYYPNHLFQIMIGKQQNFTLETDTVDFVKNMKVSNSEDNMLFFDFLVFQAEQYEKIKQLNVKQKTASAEEKKNLQKQIDQLRNDIQKKSKEIISKHSNTFFATFLTATQDVELPDRFKDKNGKLIDSLYFKYREYYAEHFFDNFNLTDKRLLRTPLYESKVKKYIELIERQKPIDSLILIYDKMIENSRETKEMFRFMLITLHNYYAQSKIMCMDRIFVHLAKKYYIPEASWSDKKYIDKLKTDVRRKSHTLCENVAHELKMEALPKDAAQIENLIKELKITKEKGDIFVKEYNAKKKAKTATKDDSVKLNNKLYYAFEEFENENFGEYISLHQQNEGYTILWFWEPSCSHCSKATPMLAEAYHKIKHLNVSVYSVFIQAFIADWKKYIRHIDEWFKFVNKHHLNDWHNLWDVHHTTQFREYYDISGTPVVFLLDKDNKIVAKKMGIEQCIDIVIEKIMRDIVDKYDDNEELKQVEAMINDKFTLREFSAMQKGVYRLFNREKGKKVEKMLDKHVTEVKKNFDTEIAKAVKIADSKARMKKLREIADHYYNTDDLKYIKESAGKLLNDDQKKKFNKHVDDRIKYKLE